MHRNTNHGPNLGLFYLFKQYGVQGSSELLHPKKRSTRAYTSKCRPTNCTHMNFAIFLIRSTREWS